MFNSTVVFCVSTLEECDFTIAGIELSPAQLVSGLNSTVVVVGVLIGRQVTSCSRCCAVLGSPIAVARVLPWTSKWFTMWGRPAPAGMPV